MWANPNYSTSHGVTTNGCANQCPYAVAGQMIPHSHKIDFFHNTAYVMWLKQPESSSEVVNITNVKWLGRSM